MSYNWQKNMALEQPLTCSIGAVAQLPDGSWQQSLRLADQALYWVKEHGRNGYMLLHPASGGALSADNTDISVLLAQGKLHATSNKDFTVIPS